LKQGVAVSTKTRYDGNTLEVGMRLQSLILDLIATDYDLYKIYLTNTVGFLLLH
jgi:hypothetical protein